MADLTAADVIITLNKQSSIGTAGRRRQTDVSIVWGDGVKNYPIGGIPLPFSAAEAHKFGSPEM